MDFKNKLGFTVADRVEVKRVGKHQQVGTYEKHYWNAYKMLGREGENKNYLLGWVWVHPEIA